MYNKKHKNREDRKLNEITQYTHIFKKSDMSKSTNTVLYFDWKTVIYIYVCGQCRTQFMLSNSSGR